MTGIERLRDVACNRTVRLTALLQEIADQIERETLPRPRFEDGEPVQFGDEIMRTEDKVMTVDAIEVKRDGGYSLWRFTSDLGKTVQPGERVKRPEPPKVLDADGVEINVGDEVWLIDDGCGPWTVASTVNGDRVKMTDGSRCGCNAHCKCITHRRPEPPDSWERIEEDVNKYCCAYFGRAFMFDCSDGKSDVCPLSGLDDECEKRMAQDLVRRCKRLAGVE